MYTHSCIKPSCTNSYDSKEEEAYYCETCQEHNKEIAKQVDAKVVSRPPKKSQPYDPYAGGKTVNVKGMKFLHVKL